MAHSINTSGEIANNHTSEARTPQVDASPWRNPVLTVRSRDSENAETGREVRFLFATDGIVVNPWGPRNLEDRLDRDEGPYCLIVGEDLFALRELLAEIPEEAFVRPADPEPESYCFIDGDYGLWVYSDHNQSWHYGEDDLQGRLKRDHPSAYPGFDSWGSAVASYGILPVRQPEPEWVDGDVIVYHASDADWVRVRQGGQWQRVTGPFSVPKDDDWADDAKRASTRWTVKRATR